MTIKTQAALLSDIATNLADNTSGAITESVYRTVLQDITDTVESEWGNSGDEVDIYITDLLANNTSGDISPADSRTVCQGIVSMLFTSQDSIVFPTTGTTTWGPYATPAAAESSGDPWVHGDTIQVTTPAEDYKYCSFLALDGHSGLVHKYPFNDGKEILSLERLGAIYGDHDTSATPPVWTGSVGVEDTDWAVSEPGQTRMGSLTTSGACRYDIDVADRTTLINVGRIHRNVTMTSTQSSTWDTLQNLYAYYDATNMVRFLTGLSRGSATGDNYLYRTNNSATNIDTGVDATTAHDMHVYCGGDRRAAIWFDFEAAPTVSVTDMSNPASTDTVADWMSTGLNGASGIASQDFDHFFTFIFTVAA